MRSNTKKGIALICTLFILMSSGYAQSNRVGVFATLQYVFFQKKTDNLTEKDFLSAAEPIMKRIGVYLDSLSVQVICS